MAEPALFARLIALSGLRAHQRRLRLVERVPRSCGLQLGVDIVDVLHSFGLEPLAEGVGTVLRIDGDSILPGGAAAENAIELYAGLAGEFEGLAELGVADSRRQINKRLGRDIGRLWKRSMASFFV